MIYTRQWPLVTSRKENKKSHEDKEHRNRRETIPIGHGESSLAKPLQTPMARVYHTSCLIFVFSSSNKMIVIVNYIQSLCRDKIYRVDMNI